MAIKEELWKLADRMNAQPEPIASLDLVYQFNLKEGGTFQVHFQRGWTDIIAS